MICVVLNDLYSCEADINCAKIISVFLPQVITIDSALHLPSVLLMWVYYSEVTHN